MTHSKTLMAVVAALLLAACGGPVVAEVDGIKITASELQNSIKLEKEKYDPVLLRSEENSRILKRAVLENLIQEAVLISAAKKEGITVSKKEVADHIAGAAEPQMLEKMDIPQWFWKEKQKRRLLIAKLIKQDLADKTSVAPEQIGAYYNGHKADFHKPVQYHARQIVVDNKELAGKILGRLKKGEDFAKLAEEFSLSPDRKHGGDLGFFNAETFPPVFAEICGKLKPGETSGVVATDYGFQIFGLIEKRDAKQLTLEEARPEIEFLLKEKEMESSFANWFAEKRGSAKITIDEKALEGING